MTENTRRAFGGHFLDLRTLAFALSDRSYSLKSACEDFGVEHGKGEAEQHGVVTPQYIEYNRRDVQATSELLMKLLEEFERHPISLQVTKAFSAASIAKSYEQAMGITPVLVRQPDFPREVLGYAMNAFYGGRAECRVRRVPLPVVYLDFTSMYPSVNALLGNFDLLTAREIRVVEATDEIRRFVAGVSLEDCFSAETWSRLACFVRVRPRGEVFPVRAKYDPRGQSWQIGSNPLSSDEDAWYALSDVVAAKLLSGQAPEIVAAVRLKAVGRQPGLRETKLRGAIAVDPRRQDFFRTIIEERKRLQRSDALEPLERKRLDKALKVTANAGSYGIFAEMNRKEQAGAKKVPVTVWRADGKTFETRVSAPEEPGRYCFPPLAALITSAARLMLAALERSVTERGGAYVFCDTDSLAIVASEAGGLVACQGGAHCLPDGREAVKALSWSEVEDIRQRFAALNPYDREAVPGSILKAEDENFDPETHEQRELWCYAISAKRNVLYNACEDERPLIRKHSRHGLGHLLNPSDPDSRDSDWTKEVWQYVLAADSGGEKPIEPAWFSRPAIGRVTVNDPRTLALFRGLNKGKPYADQVKPQNFMLSAQAETLPPEVDPTQPFHLVAPYNPDPRQWLKLRWVDRYSGKSYRVTTSDALSEGVVRIKTYRDVVDDYRRHPERKSLAPDGSLCGPTTVGLLRRRPVEATRIVYTGKESNRLEDVLQGLIADEDEVTNEYRDPSDDPFLKFVVPVLRTMPVAQVADASGVPARTVKRVRSGRLIPHVKARSALTTAAVQEARLKLEEVGMDVPRNDVATLRDYCELLGGVSHLCPVCGQEIEKRRSIYCGATCRKRAARMAKENASQ